MTEYELVREISNLCPNNQMRDVFFREVQTDDPVEYVRQFLKDAAAELSVEEKNEISHRGKAMAKMRDIIMEIL